MTVSDNTSRNQYTATSGQTVFAYTFEIVDKDHIVVLQNGTALSEGTDYIVSNVGNDNGGNVTLTSGATAGDVMTLYREMPYSRTQNYTNSGDFLASEVNADFDELWLAGEQTDRSFSQSIRKPITDSDSISMELPEAATRANKFVKFDATGAVDVAGATVTVSAEDVSIDDAGNYYTSNNVEGALQEVGADIVSIEADIVSIEADIDDLEAGRVLSVTDFGATGDGSDQTTEIQEAINHASTHGIQTIFFPDGHYKFSTLYFYYDLTLNPGFENTENKDGRFQLRGTGRLSINDLRNYDGTNTDRLYGSVLESTGDGILVETAGSLQSSRNFVAKDLSFVANNASYILRSETCPGMTFDHCSFKQLNSGGSGLKVISSWFFTMNQCYVFGAWDADNSYPSGNTGSGIEFGLNDFAGEWNITDSAIDSWKNGLLYNSSQAITNVSIRNTAIQNCTDYCIYVFDGTIHQLLLDNVYFENQANKPNVAQGISFIKDNDDPDPQSSILGRIRNLRIINNFFLGIHGPATLATTTGPMIDLDLIDFLDIEGVFVYRPVQTFLNVTDTIDAQDICGELKNTIFLTDRTFPTTPLFLLTGILPNVHNCRWPGYEDGIYDTTNDCQLFDSTADGQYLREYTDPIMGSTNISKFSFGDSNVETVTSSPYIINDAGFNEAKTYYDLTHSLNDGLAVRLPDVNEKGDGRLFIIKNNENTSSNFPYIQVFNNSDQANSIARLSPGQAGLFVYDGQGTKAVSTGEDVGGGTLETVFTGPSATNASDLTVKVDGVEKTLTTDYTVSNLNVAQGSTVTFTSQATAPADGATVEIFNITSKIYKYVGRTFHDDIILADNQKITAGRSDDIEIYHHAPVEIFEDNAAGVTNFTYTFDSPAIADRIKVERKPEGGSYSNETNFTVNLSTKLVVLGVATLLDEDIRISTSESRIDTLSGLTLDGLTYPTADGTSGQSIITDGSGNLTFGTAAGTGLQNIVEDTTPQLGGDLESNGNNILFADNDKAIFGAGSDLQIFHSGTNSFIQETGTGNLILQADEFLVQNTAGTANYIRCQSSDESVQLRHAGSTKLNTTSVGINVTGSVTADSATINGAVSVTGSLTTNQDITISETIPRLVFDDTSATDNTGIVRQANSNLVLQSQGGTGTYGGVQIKRSNGTSDTSVLDFQANGDVVIYADDGTSQDFFWDASTSRLGLGTNLPSADIDVGGVFTVDVANEDAKVTGATPALEFVENDNGGSRMRMAWNNASMIQSLYGDTTTTFGSFNLQTRASDGTNNQVVYVYDGGANDRHWWGTRAAGDVRMQLKSNGDFEVRGGDVIFENSARTSDDFFWDASYSRLGIGTDSPSYDLSVVGSSAAIQVDNTAGSPDQMLMIFQADLGTNDRNFQIKSPTTDSLDAPFRFVTSNSFAFEIDGLSTLALADNKNVGIGDEDPIDKLTVSRLGATWTGVAPNANTTALFHPGTTNATSGSAITIAANASAASSIYFSSATDNDIGLLNYSHTDNSMQFRTNNSERMRIDSSGNVGISNSSPDTSLHIGDISATNATGNGRIKLEDTSTSLASAGGLEFVTSAFGSGYGWKVNSIDSSGVHLVFATRQNSTTWSEKARLDSSGRLGLGTANPSEELDVQAATDPSIRVRSTGTAVTDDAFMRIEVGGTTASSYLMFGDADNSSPGRIRYVHSDDSMRIYAGGAVEKVRFTSNQTLFYNGTTELARFDSDGRLLIGRSSAGVSETGLRLEDVNDDHAQILISKTDSGGKIAIGNYHNGTYVGGVNYSDTATSFPTSSDQRLKDNIVDAPSASDDIDAIQVRSFDWKADGSHQKYGMVAQELQTVAPDAVSEGETEEDMMGVDYSKLVPMLVKEIQSLRARVAQLEND